LVSRKLKYFVCFIKNKIEIDLDHPVFLLFHAQEAAKMKYRSPLPLKTSTKKAMIYHSFLSLIN